MDKEELAKLAGHGLFQELVREGMRKAHEQMAEFNVRASEEQLELLEVGVATGITVATTWYVEHNMLKDLEVSK